MDGGIGSPGLVLDHSGKKSSVSDIGKFLIPIENKERLNFLTVIVEVRESWPLHLSYKKNMRMIRTQMEKMSKP